MKFELVTSGRRYNEEQATKLKKLGFEFDIDLQDTQKRLYKTECEVEIEINTLEELIKFSNEWGLIIVSSGKIEIYDNYRE